MNWYIIQCKGGGEASAVRALDLIGYPDGWYPVRRENTLTGAERRSRLANGLKPKNKRRRVALIPGYVFVQADGINVRAIHDYDREWLRAVFTGERLYRMSDADMAQMQQMPDRVRELIEAIENERRPVVGGRARIMSGGAFHGYIGTVDDIGPKIAVMDMGWVFGKVSIEVRLLEKVSG